MHIKFEGEYSEADFIKAISMSSSPLYSLVLGVFTIIAIIAVAPNLYNLIKTGAGLGAILAAVLPAIIVFGVLAWLIARSSRKQARQTKEAPSFQGHFFGTITDDAIDIASSTSQTTLQWGAFLSHKMSDELVILYQTDNSANLFPRSFFASDTDWLQFTERVQASLPEKRSRIR